MLNTCIEKILQYIFVGISFAIFLLCIFGTSITHAYKLDISRNNLIIFFVSLLIGLLVLYLISKTRMLSRKANNTNGIFVVSIILFIIQIILMNSYYFKTGWDVSVVISAAEHIAHGIELPQEINDYFSNYPNNIFITLIYAQIMSLCNWLNIGDYGYFGILLIQSIINVLSGLFLYLVLEKLCNRTIAWFGYSLYTVLLWLSPWVSIPYSDSMGLLFPILTVYLLITRESYTVIKIIAMAVMMVIGYYIKPQSAIVFIAILMISVVSVKKNNLKKLFKAGVIFITTTFIVGIGIKFFTANPQITLDKEKEISLMHFVKMGLNDQTDGGYLWEDVYDSVAAKNKQERSTENSNKIKERLSSYGLVGLAKHQVKKTLNNYNDGTFGWGLEGSFFEEIREVSSPLDYYTRNYYYLSGDYYQIFEYVVQGTWLLVLFLIIGNLFKSRHDNKKEVAIIYLTLIGLFLFESIFESRSRYLYTYVPIFIVVACLGTDSILVKLQRAVTDFSSRNVSNFSKFRR